MTAILEFLDPSLSAGEVAVRFVGLAACSVLAAWLIAAVLCRRLRVSTQDTELNVHFAWMCSFAFVAVLWSAYAAAVAVHYRAITVPVEYAGIPLFGGLATTLLVWSFHQKIRIKIRKGRV